MNSLSFPPKVLPKLPQMGEAGRGTDLSPGLPVPRHQRGLYSLPPLYHPRKAPMVHYSLLSLYSLVSFTIFWSDMTRSSSFSHCFSDFELGVPVSVTCSSLREKQSLRAEMVRQNPKGGLLTVLNLSLPSKCLYSIPSVPREQIGQGNPGG